MPTGEKAQRTSADQHSRQIRFPIGPIFGVRRRRVRQLVNVVIRAVPKCVRPRIIYLLQLRRKMTH